MEDSLSTGQLDISLLIRLRIWLTISNRFPVHILVLATRDNSDEELTHLRNHRHQAPGRARVSRGKSSG
jgi:hypothetical protein